MIPRMVRTERLTLRLPHYDDLALLYRQFADPDMCRYFSEPPITVDDTAEYIEKFQHPEQHGFARYCLILTDTGEFVGTCGYHHWDKDKRLVEAGYDIWKEMWRQGFAAEAVRPVLEICFRKLAVEHVYVLIHEENVASRATAAKLGFEPAEPCRPLDADTQVCMKLSKRRWSAWRATSTFDPSDGDAGNGL